MSTEGFIERDAVRAFVNGSITRGQFVDLVGYDPVGIMQEAREAATAKPPKRVNRKRGGIDSLPSGKWRVRYTARGKSYSKAFGSHAEAVAFRDQQRQAAREGNHVAPNAGNVTLRDYAKAWIADHGASQSTIDAHETRLRVHVFGAFGDHRLSDITADDVRRWHKRDLSSLAPNTRKAVVTSFSAVMAAAVNGRLIPSNPVGPDVIKRKRTPAKKFVPLEAEQVIAIREALPDRYKILATLGAGLGLRQGEVFGLSPNDFDHDKGLVTVQRQVKVLGGGSRLVFDFPKGGEDHPIRQVPLPDSVARAVQDYLAEFPAKAVSLPWAAATAKPLTVALIATSREGKPLNKNYVNGAIWKAALREAEVSDTRENGMHALRHFYASTLLDSGENIRAVAEYLGHSDPGFTLRTYAHVMQRSHLRSQRAIDSAFEVSKPRSVVTDLSQRRPQGA